MAVNSSTKDRGKAAEKAVEKVLKKWNEYSAFAYWRLPDARSARGYLAAQPGDMVWFCAGRGGIIEIKSTQHAYRIAREKISQLATLKKLDLAGAENLILIQHTEENVWRVVRPGNLDSDVPSWDLRSYPTYDTPEAALRSTGWFEGLL